MIKIEFDLYKGSELNPNIKAILESFLTTKQIEEIEKKGGKCKISIILNKIDRKQKNKIETKVTENIVNDLAEFKNSPEKLLSKLEEFNKTDLLQICRFINQPIRSNAKINEIKNEIVRYFQSEKIWQGISGNKN